ncbi:MAG: adenylate/guanylate cyclase domain-containing protein [Sphingobacteriales bacterium]|jgi:class 3 adenylate cyclase
MAKILVADDEADLEFLIKQKFRKQIRDQQYEFVFAMNGRQALDRIEEHPDIDIVLSDINMPEMDGLTLLSKLHESSPLIKAVIISAYGDMDNIRSAMNKGAFDFLLKPVDFKDLELTMDKTLEHVRQVKSTLKAIRENNILKMYVDESVIDYMSKGDFESSVTRNEHIQATVIFVDICAFTSIAETQPVNNVVKLLNQYFDIIVQEIIDQKGHVDKFIGDAVMAVFRGDFHLERAVQASLAIRKQIESLGKDEDINFYPKVSTGLNSGDLISGNIGATTLRRLDYTVIGDVVNTAQRLQSAAKPGQIIVNETIYQRIKDNFKCNSLGEVLLKNKNLPAHIYNIIE